ncbi:MAG: FKBP-type peptidyl-prolyl cis-trans isomerase [Cyclobacteriaceae bacterium]|nr:FKBP-type peptidyl-prolyl cis-trans isomerase [Cyclobacteriaceae bacterium]
MIKIQNPLNVVNKLLTFSLLLLAFAACNKSERETPNGFKFTVLKTGDGILPKKDQILVFNYILKDSKDSVWSDTSKDGVPGAIMINDSSQIASENGMVQMFRMLSKGDSVQVKMPVTKFFKDIVGSPSTPPGVDTTLSIYYTIGVKDFMALEQYQTYATNLQASVETKKIEDYLKDNGITTQQDPSGMRYVLYNTTGKAKPTAENCVEVKYTGKFMENGQIFDASEKIAFPLNQVIEGWRLGIPLLGIGDSATLFIPSSLGYGPRGYPGAIPPNAILIFDVTLLGIGNGFDEATRTCK